MYQIKCNGINDGLQQVLQAVMSEGKPTTSRGTTYKEIYGMAIEIANPADRYLFYPGRNNNPIAQCAEVLWVLSGKSNVDWLGRYLPRAKDFSDDGIVWRAGYGPRLRRYGNQGIDQMQFIEDMLKHDRHSRQAIINIWDASEEAPAFYNGGTKDYPCNDLIQFRIDSENKLHMSVYVRSNDAIWGFTGVNFQEWSILHEIYAQVLDAELGTYHHLVGSMHVYEHHYARAEKMAQETNYGAPEDVVRFPAVPKGKTVEDISKFLEGFMLSLDEDLSADNIDFQKVTKYIRDQQASWELCQLWQYMVVTVLADMISTNGNAINGAISGYWQNMKVDGSDIALSVDNYLDRTYTESA